MNRSAVPRHLVSVAVFGLLPWTLGSPIEAQSLDWEGRTGGLFAPFAYTRGSPAAGLSHPTAAFHMLDAGNVVGVHFQISATVGLRNRFEAGITRSSVSSVGPQAVASLFDRGFTTLHAKVKLMTESDGGSRLPTVSAGALLRWQSEHIRDEVPSDATQNGDIYVVATKTVAPTASLSVLLSGGLRATNASFMGMAGNTPSWELRGFASGGVGLSGRLFVGGEVYQQPSHIDGFPTPGCRRHGRSSAGSRPLGRPG